MTVTLEDPMMSLDDVIMCSGPALGFISISTFDLYVQNVRQEDDVVSIV